MTQRNIETAPCGPVASNDQLGGFKLTGNERKLLKKIRPALESGDLEAMTCQEIRQALAILPRILPP